MRIVIIKTILLLIGFTLIGLMTHGLALFLRWFSNSYLHPAEPVQYGLALFAAIAIVIIAILYSLLKLQEADEKIQRIMRNG